MRSMIQATPAYELHAEVSATAHGHGFRLVSFVPTARRPEEQTKFQAVFSAAELAALRDLITRALEQTGEARR